jgi:phosphoribosylglycinamide formyltransferase 2
VIYGGVDAVGIRFEGRGCRVGIPGTDLRLFGKPAAFTNRRMGVALAEGIDTDQADSVPRQRALVKGAI